MHGNIRNLDRVVTFDISWLLDNAGLSS
jgi:hypothetical protein